jgi:hypothetical protein
MVATPDRTGVLVLRIWTEGSRDNLRLRITMVDEVSGGDEEQRVVASVDDAVGTVREWLERWTDSA